ncbi:MAG: radical SAM protein [Treponema sp.]|nr:radical SAM protein [Treponema sp.]
MKAGILLIQPPFVQLNAPYPGIYYLRNFLENPFPTGEAGPLPPSHLVETRDHSIGLFERIFRRAGLERIFADAETVLKDPFLKDPSLKNPCLADTARGFLSEKDRWIAAIDRLTAFLRGKDAEWGHFLALANGVLPGGPRFDACLESLGGNPLPEDAPLLATRLLEDLAGFITHVLDPSFSLIRYSAAGTSPYRDFAQVREGLEGYILKTFYRPLLEEEWDSFAPEAPFFLGLSIPFPGCLAGALACAESARKRFGPGVRVIAGGGYVNTELRFLNDPAIFDYFDYLSFDRGYGSLRAILDRAAGETIADGTDQGAWLNAETPVYKTIYRSVRGKIVADPGIAGPSGLGCFEPYRHIDDIAVSRVFPDYRGLDFSRYILPVDDRNPMHRLWSGGRWLKAYLAHGCYWHNCAFCDVTLDYIHSYRKVPVEDLFRHMLGQAELTGVRGLHLVDEAAPPSSLVRLAELNREAGLPLVFWGNIRFERSFDPDMAALLAAGGLVGVSAGIEIAGERGFARLGKGINLEDTVRVCAAFKEAGVLIHAYLIYGYWDEDEQETMDSAEILRQLFAAGLLDSAFWHRFVLTRHSRLFAEWQRGLHPDLRPLWHQTPPVFALNDLSFQGEEVFARYDGPLDRLLAAWMAGDSSGPVGGAFPFRVKIPRIAPDLIARLLDSYARTRDRNRAALPPALPDSPGPSRLRFLGSRPLIVQGGKGPELRWRWRLGEERLRLADRALAERLASLLETASWQEGAGIGEFYAALKAVLGEAAAARAWKRLRNGGLVSC